MSAHNRSRRAAGWRSWTAYAVATVVAVGLTVAIGASEAGADSAAPTSFNLNAPAAGIHDPASALTPLALDCTAGRVDINTASEAAIGSAIGIASIPTLDRIVASRPWLRSVDAVSVPGVGPARASTLASALCATPTTLPAAASHAPPAGFTGVDLQVATAQQIADAGLLPLPVAQRLKAYGPLPDNLHQIAAPAVPGLSDPTIDKLLGSARVALTPYPFTYQGTTWRWVGHDGGAVVSAAADTRYALYVPPASVSGNGAWATVTPKANELDRLPTAGYHIYGAWTPEVGVQTPNVDGESAAGETVIHYATDGPHISTGTGAVAGPVAGTVIVAASSLSDFITTLAQQGCIQNERYLSPTSQLWCIQNLRDTPLADVFKSTLAYQAHFAGTQPGPCPVPSNPLMTVHGSMYSMTCTRAATSGTTGTVTWRNDSGDALRFGNVYRYQKSPAGLDVGINRNPDKGRFTTRIFDGMSDGMGVIPPGDGFDVTVHQGDAPATTSVRTAPQAPLFWIASQFTSLLDALSDIALPEGQMVGCALALANSPDFQSYLDCAGKALQNIITLIRGSTKLSAADDKLLASAAKKAGALGLLATGVDLGLSGIQWGSETASDTATYEFGSPPPVIGGGSTGSGAPTNDGKYIARVGRAAYLVYPASGGHPPVAESITTESDFNCYATGYFVIDNVSTFTDNNNAERMNLSGLPLVDHSSVGAPHCASMSLTWDYTPQPQGNVPFGVIVKMPDWEGRGSWRITPDGAIESIESGGVYQCLAAKAPVIFNFPFAKVQAWTPVGTTPASCP